MPKRNLVAMPGVPGVKLGDSTVRALDSLDAMWAEVDAAAPQVADVRPPNSFTAREFAERRKLPTSTARAQLGLAVDAGKFRAHLIRMVDTRGRMARVTAYTVVKP